MLIPITALYTGINGVFNVLLAGNVSRVRAQANIYLGTTGSDPLLLAARRHGNNAEYVALALVALLVCELSGGSATLLHVFGGLFTLGRVMHAYAVDATPSPIRGLGALLTWVAIAGASIYGLTLTM